MINDVNSIWENGRNKFRVMLVDKECNKLFYNIDSKCHNNDFWELLIWKRVLSVQNFYTTNICKTHKDLTFTTDLKKNNTKRFYLRNA